MGTIIITSVHTGQAWVVINEIGKKGESRDTNKFGVENGFLPKRSHFLQEILKTSPGLQLQKSVKLSKTPPPH